MSYRSFLWIPLILMFLITGCTGVEEAMAPSPEEQLAALKPLFEQGKFAFGVPRGTRVISTEVNDSTKEVTVKLSREFTRLPLRDTSIARIYKEVLDSLPAFKDSYTARLYAHGFPLEELIPNYFRSDPAAFDRSRLPVRSVTERIPLVINVSRPFVPTLGLRNFNVILWHSHGWYYSNQIDRWEWQRPRLFTAVEDKIPMSFVLPYLVPMLENAGANIFIPRERDTQENEVIVDNDSPAGGYFELSEAGVSWSRGDSAGFKKFEGALKTGVNPFKNGTTRIVRSDVDRSASANFIPSIPATGEYAVYASHASYPNSSSEARYFVYHRGGITELRVNQKIGGGTWTYLGTFPFKQGYSADSGKVVVTNATGETASVISVDAVRFGGGMGIVERGGRTSGRPKYLEGARYYLQYAGMPDTIVYNLNRDADDYRDDFQSRAEYGNYLMGAPFGPERDRASKGLGIPIDYSLSFHTDAGIAGGDTVIGTLSIFTLQGMDTLRVFGDGVSRMANRDVADLLQTQIVDDLRFLYNPEWARRDLREASYAESMRPNFPSVLLELLSHQNFADMKYVLDPTFRFAVSRSIYKAILRYLRSSHGLEFAVQPLPISHFSALLSEKGEAVLHWRPVEDPLEPSAKADEFVVYTRIGDGGFDNGKLVRDTIFVTPPQQPGIVYSYRVTALNKGGESLPSEILAVGRGTRRKPPVMIVNAFTRVSAPSAVEQGPFAGFYSLHDQGVEDRVGFIASGSQHDFDVGSRFITNDAPGHGASWADLETKKISGNMFDYPFVHGSALLKLGFSFSSASVAAMMDSTVTIDTLQLLDVILGEQKRTPWQKQQMDSLRGLRFDPYTVPFRNFLDSFLSRGGKLFISGAYVASELTDLTPGDTARRHFARNTLRLRLATPRASRNGKVMSATPLFLPAGTEFTFNTIPDPALYTVEAPDAIGPVAGGAQLLRYKENEFGAGVGWRGQGAIVALGFPFESVIENRDREMLMEAILKYLDY